MVAGILGGAGNLNPMYEGMAKGAKMHIRQYSGLRQFITKTVVLFYSPTVTVVMLDIHH